MIMDLFMTTVREPIPARSALERLALAFLDMKRRQEFEKAMAFAQIFIAASKAPEAMKEYYRACFPWLEEEDKLVRLDHQKILEREVKAGPLVVTKQRTQVQSRLANKAQQQPVRSRLQTRRR